MVEEQKINILVEVLAGIDPTETSLVTGDIGEYWMPDEADTLTETGYDGIITGDLWTVESGSLVVNQAGTTSSYWEIETTSLIVS